MIPHCQINFNNFPNITLSTLPILEAEMAGKLVELNEGDRVIVFVTRDKDPLVIGDLTRLKFLENCTLSIAELNGGGDGSTGPQGPSGPQGPTGPAAQMAPASAIRVCLDINATSEEVASPDGLQYGRGNTTIENEQR